jgi:hypothetical protein
MPVIFHRRPTSRTIKYPARFGRNRAERPAKLKEGTNYGDFGFRRAFPVLARPLTLWQGSAAL